MRVGDTAGGGGDAVSPESAGDTHETVVCRSKLGFGQVTCGFSVGQAACVYSLSKPPRTGLRWIRAVSRSVTVAREVSRSASGTC